MTSDKLPLSRLQRVVRIIGAVILTACALMIILGTTIWEDQLQGPRFAIYWSWCFLLAVAAIVVALWDMILVRRAFQRSRRELFEKEFMSEDFINELKQAKKREHPQ